MNETEIEKEIDKEFKISLYKKSSIIDTKIYLFLYTLLKKIFVKPKIENQNKLNKHLDNWINKINEKIIMKKDNYISTEYTYKNLKNIIYFAKRQNYKYNGDIIESILILIFSDVFKIEQDNVFGKYIFNNLAKIRERGNLDIIKWINKDKLIPKDFNDLEKLLESEPKEEDNNNNKKPNVKNNTETIFYKFLKKILEEKYSNNNIFNYNENRISEKYIHQGDYLNIKFCKRDYEKIIEKEEQNIIDKDIATNSIMNMASSVSSVIPIIRSFFTQVYIHYQNRHSPLLKYTQKLDDYAIIPFVYDLRGACIEGRFSPVVLAPLMVQDLYSKIFLKQNNFRELGLFELGKICVLNKNIKTIECDTCLIKSQYLDFLTYGMGIFDNKSVEEINLSYNYLKEFSEEFLIKLFKNFKGLKTLNISSNEMKGGLGNVFIVLKKLYRKRKTNFENLILNKCLLDDSSLYELGELLKCKYCKLKKIVLNNNPYPYNCNLLKKLKNNKSLAQIHLNKDDIYNFSVEDILRIISNTNIRYLYLFKNRFDNFNDFLKIIYRTKIIDKKKVEILKYKIIPNEETGLINLDLSNNEYPIRNHYQIKLLKNIIEETSLYCLDICHILFGINPERYKDAKNTDYYKKSVEEIKEYLEGTKKKYSKIIQDIRINQANKNNSQKKLENNTYYTKYEGSEEIMDILKNKKAIYSAYLKVEAEKIVENDKNNDEKDDNVNDNKKEDYIENIMNYLLLKRSEKNLDELKKIKYQKKLIII